MRRRKNKTVPRARLNERATYQYEAIAAGDGTINYLFLIVPPRRNAKHILAQATHLSIPYELGRVPAQRTLGSGAAAKSGTCARVNFILARNLAHALLEFHQQRVARVATLGQALHLQLNFAQLLLAQKNVATE